MNKIQENAVNPDEILAQMAQDVPEMPADFHARWTEQIRTEAAGSKEADRRQESRRQWRYFLSAVAVFVFLIGGTLLTRSMKTADLTTEGTVPLKMEKATVNPTVEPVMESAAEEADKNTPAFFADMAEETAGGSAWTAGAAMEAAMEEAVYEDAESAAADDWMTDAAVMEEAAEAPMMNAAAPAEANRKNAASASREAEADFAAVEEAPMAAEAEVYAAEEAEAPMAEEAPVLTAAVTAALTATATAKSAPVGKAQGAAKMDAAKQAEETVQDQTVPAEATDAGAESAEAAEEPSEFISFLKDFGIFTLKTLAVAAAAAAVVFGVLALRRALRKRK